MGNHDSRTSAEKHKDYLEERARKVWNEFYNVLLDSTVSNLLTLRDLRLIHNGAAPYCYCMPTEQCDIEPWAVIASKTATLYLWRTYLQCLEEWRKAPS